MALQIQGQGGVVADVDGSTFRALRVANKPYDHGAFGHYRVSVVTGTLAATLAASAQVYQFKWTDATRFGIIFRVRTRFLPLTLFTAATLTDATSFDAFVARSYSAGGGGTTVTLTGNNGKARTSMGTTLAVINVSTTAALTAATTLDANPFAQSIRKANRVNPAAATEEVIPPAFDGLEYAPDISAGEHPIVLAQNEGFVIRNRTVWPAAGTGILLVETIWGEGLTY